MMDTESIKVGNFKVDVIRDDQYISNTLKLGYEWDGWMRYDIPHIYMPGTDIIDVGANIGWNSLMFSDYGPVHSFEPLFHEIVSKNISQNNLQNIVKVYPFGLSSENTEREIFIPEKIENMCNYGGTSLHPHVHQKSGTMVKLVKLDDIYKGRVSLIKIDVEGHELDVIKGSLDVISKNLPSLYIEIFDFSDECEIVKILKSFGYNVILNRPEHNYLFISPLAQNVQET